VYNSIMDQITRLEPVDYLAIGHLTIDLTAKGPRIGGTVAYSALTARALGLRVGIITSWGEELPLGLLEGIPIVSFPTEKSTTFENIETNQGRIQYIYHIAPSLHLNLIPDSWRNAPIVHLAPIAQEVDPSLVRHFPDSLIGVTPQGWLRTWDVANRVSITEWPEASFVLQRAGAAVISINDINRDEARIEEMATACRVLAVTESAHGSRLYWNGDIRRFRPPEVAEIDSTGAGDIFATCFFSRLYTTRDPWEAARFATHLSALSVTRAGMDSIPTQQEIQDCMIEVF
jgi:sugar/nucleoside kinase (ribokinase family)